MRVAIAGAGNVGRAIARELLDNGHQVLLIDKDPKALKLESVPDAEWLMADACEIASLDNAHLNTCQVLVAATGDDKANLVTSLLGKTEYGVPRVVARINHPKNEWLFDSSWGVDVAVSTPRIIAALVEEAVSVGDVVRLFALVFLVFDVELVFMYPWAVVVKDIGMLAFVEILIFMFILFMGLLYAWKKGALKWV